MLQRGFQSLRSLKQISLWWAVIQAAVISQRDCFLGWQRQLARGPVRSCQMAARRSHLINSRSLNVVQSRAEVLFINYCFPSLYRPEFEISCHKQQVSIQTLLELVLTMWNFKKNNPKTHESNELADTHKLKDFGENFHWHTGKSLFYFSGKANFDGSGLNKPTWLLNSFWGSWHQCSCLSGVLRWYQIAVPNCLVRLDNLEFWGTTCMFSAMKEKIIILVFRFRGITTQFEKDGHYEMNMFPSFQGWMVQQRYFGGF